MVTITAGLCAGLLPGCALFGTNRATSKDTPNGSSQTGPGQTTDKETASRFIRPPVERLPDTDPLAILTSETSPYHPLPGHYLVSGSGVGLGLDQKPLSDHPPDAEQQSAVGPKEGGPSSSPKPGQPQPTVEFHAAPPGEKKEPLLEALEWFLQNQPQKALEVLKSYQRSSQDVYIILLPVLAQLTHKGVDQLSPEEASAMDEQMHTLEATLRSRARLIIDKICFCEWIKGYGSYQALPQQHGFRPQTAEQPGELVQLYVELRNFSMEPCPQGYLTRLSSKVEIRDQSGKAQWEYNFKNKEGPLYKQSPWHDCLGNYRFYMPRIPPGTYTLTITIEDLTRPGVQRIAEKSLELQVAL
jgi:hypothetical protein